MKIVVLIFIGLLLLLTVGCDVKTTTEKIYGISFTDSTTLENLQNKTGAESISGYMTTYTDTDSIEHVLVTMTINNPRNNEELAEQGEVYYRQITDSIIKSIGYTASFDSLVIHYTTKSSILLLFSEKTTTYSCNQNIIYPARSKFFHEQEKWSKIFDSLEKEKEWEKISKIADSLSRINGFSDLVFIFKANSVEGQKAENLEDIDNLSEVKEMVLKELLIRPFSRVLNNFLGSIYYKKKQYDLSAKYYDNVLRQCPRMCTPNYYRGYIYAYARDYSSAMKHFLRVKETGSTMADKVIQDLRKAGY